MNRFTVVNELLASKATIAFSSMWAFYVFVLYGLMPLLLPKEQNNLLYWSNVVQLIALPLLAVGQRVLANNDKNHAKSLESLHDKHDALQEAITGKEAEQTP